MLILEQSIVCNFDAFVLKFHICGGFQFFFAKNLIFNHILFAKITKLFLKMLKHFASTNWPQPITLFANLWPFIQSILKYFQNEFLVDTHCRKFLLQ